MKPWKISGAGNTFLIEALEAGQKAPSQAEVRGLCEKHQVDGYLSLTQLSSEPNLFHWYFLNRDGSEAEFCGNAARCAQYFLSSQLGLKTANHKTRSGIVSTWSDAGNFWVKMPRVQIFKESMILQVEAQSLEAFWCDTGVPHLVVFSDQKIPDRKLSERLRFHPDLGTRGANITWVLEKNSMNTLASAVTFERGVEDFTQACGTGALAAAVALQARQPDRSDFQINMPGGTLRVQQQNGDWVMTGPVEKLDEWQGSAP